jgi:MFS family permease
LASLVKQKERREVNVTATVERPAPALRARLRDLVRSYPAAYWYLWIGTFVNRLGGFVVPFLAIYLTEVRGMTIGQAGGVISAYGAGTLAAGPLGGLLADRLGRRRTLLLSLVLTSIGMVTMSAVRSPAALVITAAALGFVTDVYRPPVFAMVADVVAPERRPQAYALLYWVVNLGVSFAPVIAGVMAKRNFQALFIADAITTLVFAAVVFFRIPETRPVEAVPAHERPHPFAGITVAFRDGVFLAFTALSFLTTLLFFQYQVALPVAMRADGISSEAYGVTVATNGVLIVLLQPWVSRIVAKYRRSRVMAVGAVFIGAGFGLNAFADTQAVYMTGVAIWTLGEITLLPVASAVVADMAPPEARGRYQGAYFMSWGLGLFAAPLLGANVLEAIGPRAFWAGCLAIGLLAAAGHLAVAPSRARRLRALGLAVTAD